MLTQFLAQAPEIQGTSLPQGSSQLLTAIIVCIVLGLGLVFAFMNMPANLRRPVVVTATFLAGFFYVLQWLWPKPIKLEQTEIPANNVEWVGLRLQDGLGVFSNVTQTLTAFLLGLGVYSVLRVHGTKLVKQQKDWQYSLVLLISMFAMAIVGFVNYNQEIARPGLKLVENYGPMQLATDFLFDGMLQAMDAAMFSIIAFFILFAAYRAFRIRSVESTILLGTALIVMLSLMAGIEYFVSESIIGSITGGDVSHFANNFSLVEIRKWIADNFQAPGIRALEWGILIGSLSMGLRLWLSLEKGGGK
jgi:hypothetical protein